jgi:hypothetical protein
MSSPKPEEGVASDPPSSALELEWDTPAGCPDAQAVRAEVLRLAGTQGSRRVMAKGSIRQAGDSDLTLTLTTAFDGVTGERTLKGVACDSLTDAAALVLAVIVNPDLALGPPEPAAPPPAQAAPSQPRTRPLMSVGAYAGLQTGAIEALSPSYMLSLGMGLGRFSLHLLPGLTPPQDVSIPNTERKVGGRLWLGTVDALGCWSVGLGPAVLRPCLGWNVTRLHGRGLGVAQPSESTVYWSAAELAVFAGLPLSRHLLLEIGGIGQVPLHRPRVYLDDIGAVSQPASLGLKALGGLAWIFD